MIPVYPNHSALPHESCSRSNLMYPRDVVTNARRLATGCQKPFAVCTHSRVARVRGCMWAPVTPFLHWEHMELWHSELDLGHASKPISRMNPCNLPGPSYSFLLETCSCFHLENASAIWSPTQIEKNLQNVLNLIDPPPDKNSSRVPKPLCVFPHTVTPPSLTVW